MERHRARQLKVVEAADVEGLDIEIERWLSVRRVERAADRVPVGHHIHVESSLHIRHRAGHVEYGAIGMGPRDRQAMRFRETR